MRHALPMLLLYVTLIDAMSAERGHAAADMSLAVADF